MKFLTLIMLCTLAFSGCGEEVQPGRTPVERPIVSGIRTGVVSRTEHALSRSLAGTVRRPDRSTLAARIDGRVGRFAVREGEKVERGDLLLTLEENQAEAGLREAEAGLQQAQGEIAVQRARLDLAEKTYERYARLREGEAVTPQEMDRVRSELATAKQSLVAAKAAGRRAEARRNQARIGEGYTRVTAPYAAVVVRKEAQEGATVMPGAPLVTLDSLGGWQVLTDIPESSLDRVRLGDVLPVRIPAANLEIPGKVVEIFPSADSRSRSFPAKLKIPDSPALRAGQYARVTVPGAPEVLVTVPPGAVVTRGQLTGVYLLEDGTLHYRQVKTGREVEGGIEILSGLSGGETIVTAGVEKARNGARVEG